MTYTRKTKKTGLFLSLSLLKKGTKQQQFSPKKKKPLLSLSLSRSSLAPFAHGFIAKGRGHFWEKEKREKGGRGDPLREKEKKKKKPFAEPLTKSSQPFSQVFRSHLSIFF